MTRDKALPAGGANDTGTRLIQLDIFRGIAILMVLTQHGPIHPETWPGSLRIIIETIMRFTWTSIDLFFVLSGFLVSGLLFSEYKQKNNVDVGRFLIRRGFKIYPAYYCLLLATVLIRNTFSSVRVDLAALCSQIVFLQNYGPRIWAHTWSLAVEEHFYFFLSFLTYFLIKRKIVNPLKPIIPIFLLVAASAMIFRYLTGPTDSIPKFFFPTHLRMDSLFFGVLLSYFYQFHREKSEKFLSGDFHKFLLPILAILTFYCLSSDSYILSRCIGFTLLYLFYGYLLFMSLRNKSKGNFFSKSIAYIGIHSYSIYLWHMPIYHWLGRYLDNRGYSVHPALYFAVTIGGGIILGKMIEIPALALRDKLFPSKAKIFISETNAI